MAEQALSSIKTVKQLNGENHEEEIYQGRLEEVKDKNLSFGLKIALSMGLMQGSMFLLYALGYWYGSNCAEGNHHCPEHITGKKYSSGDVITVFFAVLVSCFSFSQVSPALKKISEGL